jgi:hypothetical protein
VKMVDEIRLLTSLHKLGQGSRVKVFTTSEAEHWPFPWYFRDFSRIKYYIGVPEEGYLDGEFLIVHPDLKDALLEKLKKEYYDPQTDYSLREGIILNLLYSQTIRDAFLEAEQ